MTEPSTRALATIRTINNVENIKNKDFIALAFVDGWQTIIRKEQFKVGDKVIFCEIDSILPEKPEFEFLRDKKFRVKTMKMAGVISQGLCIPMSLLPDNEEFYHIGQDVTDILGIKKYEYINNDNVEEYSNYNKSFFEKLLSLFRKKNNNNSFPSFVSKTDEIRIENATFFLKSKTPFVATEKIDGCSGTYILKRIKSKNIFKRKKYEYYVCSRNQRLPNEDNSVYWYISHKYNIEQVLKKVIGNKDWIAIQGEIIAPKVQGNKYKVKEPDIYLFNVLSPEGRLDSLSAKYFTSNMLNMKFVPIINDSYILPDTIEELRKYAHNKSVLHNINREGLVFRSLDGKLSFKCVDPKFLLQYNE